jgi:hypothetical protein
MLIQVHSPQQLRHIPSRMNFDSNSIDIYFTFIPLMLQVIMLIQVHYSPQQIQDNLEVLADVDKYLYDLLLINSIADSIIYTVRIHDVKVGLYKLFRCASPDTALNRSVSMSHRFKHSTRSVSALPQELETFA